MKLKFNLILVYKAQLNFIPKAFQHKVWNI